MIAAGWTAAAIVLAGILTARLDSGAEHFLHLGALIAGMAFLLYAALRRMPLRFHFMVLLPAACAAWASLQVVWGWTASPYDTSNAAGAWLARAAVFALAYAGFRNRGDQESCAASLAWFGGAYALFALLVWYSGDGSAAAEAAGTFGNRNHYAALIELLLPFALAQVLAPGRFRVPAAICAGLMFASVVASGSRAGVAIVTVETLIFLTAACLRGRSNYRAAAVVLASAVLCTLIGGWTHLAERFSQHDLFSYRREMLTATAAMIASRPLTGFGLGAWASVYPRFAVFDPPGVFMNHAHNDWAEWAADGGVPMLILTVAFAVATLFLLPRRRMLALGAVAVFAHGLVDFPLQKPALVLALMFVTGLVAASVSGDRRANSEGLRSCEPQPR